MRKDIEGVSLITFFFGTLSCSAVLLDGVMTNWPRFHCCKLIVSHGLKCGIGLEITYVLVVLEMLSIAVIISSAVCKLVQLFYNVCDLMRAG